MKNFLKIFLIFTFLAADKVLSGSTFVVSDNIKLHFDNLIPSQQEEFINNYVKKTYAIVNKIFKKKKNANAINMEVYFAFENQDNLPDFYVANNCWTAKISNLKELDVENNFAFREQLISMVLHSYLADSKTEKLYRPPRWIALAIDSQIPKQQQKQQRTILRVRNMPGLKIILQGNNTNYELEKLNDLDNMEFNSVEVLILGDLCRFITDLCQVKNSMVLLQYIFESFNLQQQNKSDKSLFNDIIIPHLQKQAERYFAESNRILNNYYKSINKKAPPITEEQKAKNFQKYLQVLAENYVYHSQRPCPAPLLRNKFEQTCSIQIPELNAEKMPTDKFYTVSISQLPELMRSRPDSELIKYEIISRFFRLHNIASTDVKKALENLIETLQKCRNSIIFGSSSREIKNDIEKVYEAIDYQSEIEDLLYKTELENLNFYQLYPYEIKTINEYFNSMGSSEIQRFMLETEENFYGTF